jgi:hypothetical protein
MADIIPATELRAGDIMLDANGDLTVELVQSREGFVRVFVAGVEDSFAAAWDFHPEDLCRVASRPAVTS